MDIGARALGSHKKFGEQPVPVTVDIAAGVLGSLVCLLQKGSWTLVPVTVDTAARVLGSLVYLLLKDW